MFPTSGYFRGVTCPYFIGGLCERPYCHFRHVKPEERPPESLSSHRNTNFNLEDGHRRSSSLLTMVGDAIKQVQRDIDRDKVNAYVPQSKQPGDPTRSLPVYKPSPIGRPVLPQQVKHVDPPQPLKPVLLRYGQRITIPEYKPTPIKLLQEKKNETSSNLEYDPTINVVANKSIKRLSPVIDYKPTKKLKSNESDVGVDHVEIKLESEQNSQTLNSKNGTEITAESKCVNDGYGQENIEYQLLNSKDQAKPAVQYLPTKKKVEVEAEFSDGDDTNKETCKKSKKIIDTPEACDSNVDDKVNSFIDLTDKDIKSESQTSDSQVKTKDKNIWDLIDNKLIEQSSTGNKEPIKSEQTEIIYKPEKNKSNSIKDKSSINTKEQNNVKCRERHHSKRRDKDHGKKSHSSKDDKSNHKCIKHEDDSKTCDETARNKGYKHSSDKHTSHGHSSHSSSSQGHSSRSNSSHGHSSEKSSSHSHYSHGHSSHRHSSHRHSSKKHSPSRHSSERRSSQRSSPSHSRYRSSSSSHRHSSGSSSHSSSQKLDGSMSHVQSKHEQKSSSKKSCSSDQSSDRDMPRNVSQTDLFGSDDTDDDDDVIIITPDPPSEEEVELSSESSDLEETGLDMDALAKDANLDDHNTYEECLKIFQESMPVKIKTEPCDKVKKVADPVVENVIAGIKRTAHEKANLLKHKVVAKSRYRPSPSQVMYNRMREMQKHLEQQAEEASQRAIELMKKNKTAAATCTTTTTTTTTTTAATSASISGPSVSTFKALVPTVSSSSKSISLHNMMQASHKQRVAHLPNMSSVSQNIGQLAKTNKKKLTLDSHPTRCGTASEKRTAHTPMPALLKRPIIPTEYGSKIPTNIRQRYLNLFIDDCLKIYPNQPDAYERALAEEKGVYERSSSRTVYLNVAVNTVKKLRNEVSTAQASTSPGSSPGPKNPKVLSHQAMLGGAKASVTSFTLHRSRKVPLSTASLTGAALYRKLQEYVMTEEQLIENGFPMSSDKSGIPIIHWPENRKKPILGKPNERICIRCGTRFAVTNTGAIVSDDECNYHWGRCFKRKIAGILESRYTCCDGDLTTKGCVIGTYHVHENNKFENYSGYVKTMPCSPRPDSDYGIYALDCEMLYTLAGSELARVTVIGANLKPVYETLVKPDKMILDYNTRFSGITENDLQGITTTIRDVQAVLLNMFNDKTILIGHSLESDFVALKLIHQTVIDTSVVFPHKLGPPYKRALRNLMSEHLQKIIQQSEGGHDSLEDAVACMELMTWKMKQDAKKIQRCN